MRTSGAGSGAQSTASSGVLGQVWTLPNLVSFLRLLGVPVFLWLVVVAHADVAGFVLLMLAGLTDWLDGHLARRLDQRSRLGELLDPVADRLYIFAVVLALAWRDIVPWWLAVLLPLRDVVLWGLVPVLRSRGLVSLPVHFVGKAATFNLLYAFPLLLLSGIDGTFGLLAQVLGWAFAVWGCALYWWAGLLYVWQVRALVQQVPPLRRVVT